MTGNKAAFMTHNDPTEHKVVNIGGIAAKTHLTAVEITQAHLEMNTSLETKWEHKELDIIRDGSKRYNKGLCP